jgi:uncharacterized protein YndB with AHSA1/START domain
MKTIVQTLTFAATPAELFEMYLDSRTHTEATGGEAQVGRDEGEPFTAWDGYIEGRNLRVVPGRLIVQSWRDGEFGDGEPDSILVLRFDKAGKGGRVTMVHTNVPDARAKALTGGWHDFYWKPWKAYLAARAGAPAKTKTRKKAAKK